MKTPPKAPTGIHQHFHEPEIDDAGTPVVAGSLADIWLAAAGYSAQQPTTRTVSISGGPPVAADGESREETYDEALHAGVAREMCETPPARAQKRRATPADSGGNRPGSTAQQLRQKRTKPDGTGSIEEEGALHQRSLGSDTGGGLMHSPLTGTVHADSAAQDNDSYSSTSMTVSAPAPTEGPRRAPEATLNDAPARRSTRRCGCVVGNMITIPACRPRKGGSIRRCAVQGQRLLRYIGRAHERGCVGVLVEWVYDFLPFFHGLSFMAMCNAPLKGLRVKNLLSKPLLKCEGGLLRVDEDDVVRFLGFAFYQYYKRKGAFSAAGTTAADILHKRAGGHTTQFVNWVRFLRWKMGGTTRKDLVPSVEALRFQAQRAGAVLEYWQGGWPSQCHGWSSLIADGKQRRVTRVRV
ncbi:unnamed protein product [Sphacelaria rigidula]